MCGATEDVGDFFEDIGEGVVSVATDIYEYVTNEDEVVVLESPLPIAFYRGRLVIKTSLIGKDAFSFGVMVIGTGNVNDPAGEGIKTVKHEYGHTVQFDEYGILGFTAFVAIPSVIGYHKDKNGTLGCYYYDQPWERQADIYGGVTRTKHSPSSAADAAEYRKTTLTITKVANLLLDILMIS